MIKIYKNNGANAIFIEDDNGAQFFNSIQAVILDPASTKVSVYDNVKDLYLVYEEEYTLFVNENGAQWGTDAQTTANALNAIFTNSGTPTGDLPSITSSLTVELQQGDILNYELTADYGVGYEWDLSAVSGITTVEGNIRKLIGGSSLGVGSYNIPVKAINYNGEDSQTLVLNVTAPAFANTKSVEFQNNDWLGGNAGILSNVLGRVGNGSGASEAWTISTWFKAGTSTSNSQTILYFGGASVGNDGHLYLRYRGGTNALEFRYGTNFNFLKLTTNNNSLPVGVWKHILISYDGGTTGAASGSIGSYYGRFKIYIDGVLQTTTNTNSNFGYTGGLNAINFRVGRYNTGASLRNGCKVDELALWDSDRSADIAAIYNGGTPNDLNTLGTAPIHWWRMGDGDTYPFLLDTGTAANLIFIMNSMSPASIVNDTP
jgi:hypothetical protein